MIGSVIKAPSPCRDSCKDCSNHCSQKNYSMPTVNEALKIWFDNLHNTFNKCEEINLDKSLGRIAFETIYSQHNIPTENCASHDGIAIKRVLCEKRMAQGECILEPNEFVHVPMGTVIPEGYDTVAHAEQCRLNNDGTATLLQLPILYQSIKLKGTYISKGEEIIKENERLSPSHCAILKYTGNGTVIVKKKPKIAIIPIGNDIVEVDKTPGAGEYIECDSMYIKMIALESGGDAYVTDIVSDNEKDINAAIKSEASNCDIIITIGGIGRGEQNYADYAVNAIRNVGRIFCYGVKLDPGGKNIILGEVDNTPLLGIPGPPHAAIIITEFFVPSIIEHLLAKPCYKVPELVVTLEEDLPERGGNEKIWEVRLKLKRKKDGYYGKMVDYLGDTVDNFVNAVASISVTGDLNQFKAGKKVNVKLLKSIHDIPFIE